jgi:ABC-type oligopeptide transport system substrate-binding subunit
MYGLPAYRLAYWDEFARPARAPKYALGLDYWWSNPAGSARVAKFLNKVD